MDQKIAVLIQTGRVVVPCGDSDVFGELREQLIRARVDQFTQATINIGQGHDGMVEEMDDLIRHVKPRAAARGGTEVDRGDGRVSRRHCRRLYRGVMNENGRAAG